MTWTGVDGRMSAVGEDALGRARRLAEEVLAPVAAEVDATGHIPDEHFAALAGEGLYGLGAPPEDGGPDLPFAEMLAVVEVLAGACLTTTFTWMQHHGVVRGLAATANAALREEHLTAAMRGDLRGGVAFAGAIPQPPRLWAARVDGGYRLEGDAPFVTGWGIVDVLLVSARDAATADAADDDHATIVSLLADAVPSPGLVVHPLAMAAVQGSATVRLAADGWFVPEHRLVATPSRAQFTAGMTLSARVNGSLALGVTGRCVRLIDEAGHRDLSVAIGAALDRARAALDAALEDPSAMPVARADASLLAQRAAAALFTASGSAGLLGRHPAQRLLREAAFTLVAAGRPEIQTALIHRLGR